MKTRDPIQHNSDHSPPAAPAGLPVADKPLQIGEFLVSSGVVKQRDIEKALGIQRARGGRLGSILVELNICSEEAIRKALKEKFGVEVIDLEQVKPNPDLLGLLSPEIIRKYEVIPLKVESDKLWIAMLDPYNLLALDDIRFLAGISKLVVTTCTEGDFRRFTSRNLPADGDFQILQEGEFYSRAIQSLSSDENFRQLLEEPSAPAMVYPLQTAKAEPPIIALCNFLFLEAIRLRASDIHIEPYESALRVRIRVDGHLQTLLEPPKKLAAAIIARLKTMAELDLTRRRTPQDGQVAVACQDGVFRFRIATLPTLYGEKCAIRQLSNEARPGSLDELNFSPEDLSAFKKALASPQGLILLAGPRGSGKTTTAYAGINAIRHPALNIVTLESPVEADLFGITQVPVNPQAGVTYAGGLAAVLQQNPDVIFVAATEEPEVAKLAVQAAEAGHLVITTLATGNTAESIERLLDLGVPAYSLANSLLLVIAQRLVRRICDFCARPHRLTAAEIALLGITPAQLATATPRIAHGCKECLGTGYRERIALFEILPTTRDLKDHIRRQAGPPEILEAAGKAGSRTLFAVGRDRVLRGETSVAELSRSLLGQN